MKKKIALIAIFSMIATTFTGCGSDKIVEVDRDGDGKLNVVCTIYPVYNWLEEIGGDRLNVEYLLDSGIDLHNYNPTVEDMIVMKESDLLVYVGGDSDAWATDVVDGSFNALNLMDKLGDEALDQEVSEGMQEHDHDHDHEHSIWYEMYSGVKSFFGFADDHDHDHDHDHSHDLPDEHIWMSVKKAELIVEDIVEELCRIDEEYADVYTTNGAAYIQQLVELDEKYESELSEFEERTIVVADRFPLLYLTEDYDLDYYGAFSGCSAEVEVSFETIKFMTDKVKELELEHVFKIEGSTIQIAETVMSELGMSNENILEINSMQSVIGDTSEFTYISLMEDNLEALKFALSK